MQPELLLFEFEATIYSHTIIRSFNVVLVSIIHPFPVLSVVSFEGDIFAIDLVIEFGKITDYTLLGFNIISRTTTDSAQIPPTAAISLKSYLVPLKQNAKKSAEVINGCLRRFDVVHSAAANPTEVFSIICFEGIDRTCLWKSS